MALIDDFKARFPEFDTSVVNAKFPLIEPEWPCYYNRPYADNACDDAAILMLCAHIMAMEVAAGNQAGVGTPSRSQQSKSVGSVSVSYDQQTQTGGAMFDFFRTTSYGQRYLRLIAKYAPGGLFL